MNDEPIEVNSSDDETPYTDCRSSLGKGHPSPASRRGAMSAGRAGASSSKQTPPKATNTKASKPSSTSKGKRKRNDSDDDSEFEGKKSKSSAPRRKFLPFEKWEDDVFVEAILANYTPDHQAVFNEINARRQERGLPPRDHSKQVNDHYNKSIKKRIKSIGSGGP